MTEIAALSLYPSNQSFASVYAAIGDVTGIRTESPEWELSVDGVPERMRPDTQLVVLTNPSNPTE